MLAFFDPLEGLILGCAVTLPRGVTRGTFQGPHVWPGFMRKTAIDGILLAELLADIQEAVCAIIGIFRERPDYAEDQIRL